MKKDNQKKPSDFTWDISGVMHEVIEKNDPLIKEDDNEGYYSETDSQIVLKPNMNIQRQWKIFLHEVLHGFEEQYNITIAHKAINQLETAFYQFIKVNIDKLRHIQ